MLIASRSEELESERLVTKGFYGEYRMCVPDTRMIVWRKWDKQEKLVRHMKTVWARWQEMKVERAGRTKKEIKFEGDKSETDLLREACKVHDSSLREADIDRIIESIMASSRSKITGKSKEGGVPNFVLSAKQYSFDEDRLTEDEMDELMRMNHMQKDAEGQWRDEDHRRLTELQELKIRMVKKINRSDHPEHNKNNRDFKNIEDWKDRASTKFKVIARILRFVLRAQETETDPEKLPHLNEDGTLMFPDVDGGPPRPWFEVEDEVDDGWKETKTKVIVYFDFIELMGIFERVSFSTLIPRLVFYRFVGVAECSLS